MGYADPWSVAPGERIAFMVSAEAERYASRIVRLERGGPRTGGRPDAARWTAVGAPADGTHPGGVQALHPGSYVVVPGGRELRLADGVTAQAWVCPTAPGRGRRQGLVARRTAAGAGFAMVLDEDGALACEVGGELVSTGAPLLAGHWYLVAVSVDARAGVVRLVQRPQRPYARVADAATCEPALRGAAWLAADAPVLLGAAAWSGTPERPAALGCLDGKLEAPCLLDRPLDAREASRLAGGADLRELAAGELAGDWDFARDLPLRRVTDVSAAGRHGEVVNAPLRAVTGHRWTGRHLDHRLAPAEYGAIHFHADDLDDARWRTSLHWDVPADQPSGAYGVELRAGDDEAMIVFFVRPPRDRATARVAVLASTFTYQAYSNYRLDPIRAREISGAATIELDEADHALAARADLGLSLYNRHGDGSGVAHVSRRRPMLNVHPGYRWFLSGGGGWSFSGDMYLIDWLEASGIAYDVITDEDLHEEGAGLLGRYRVLMTGMHPEYVTEEMLDAIEGFTHAGGRLMYLGGNGFYWVTTVLPDRPHVVELRRGHKGTRAWSSAPGEEHHANGDPGGLWRHRGRAPQRLAGVGFTAQGGGPSVPYRRTPESRDPRVAFMFAGVGDGPIGDDGNNGGGAAGEEIDRADVALGTPPDALVVATSQGEHSDVMLHVVEEVPALKPGQGGTECPEVRADLTYFETAGGGAVFSTGSIDWIASLSHDDYDNDVARITGNVLREFLDDA